MDTLLTFDDDRALIGDWDGHVRTEVRPADVFAEDWKRQVRNEYEEPDRGYADEEGAPFSYFTGDHYEEGRRIVDGIEGLKPYETFSDESLGLSVRATFLPHIQKWVVADKEREHRDEVE